MDRKQTIIKLRKNNWTWQAIGVYFGISKARAHQVGSGYKPGIGLYEKALERDNNICQWQEKCDGNSPYKDLIVHHIDFNDRNNKLKNLITLCRFCHAYFHKKFVECGGDGHRKTTKLRKCLICEKEILWSKKCCSRECRKEYTIKKMTTICHNCGIKFVRKNRHKMRNYYCSRKCYFNYVAQKKLDN